MESTKVSNKKSRYERALESSPGLLDSLRDAAQESLSLRDEVAAARAVLTETMRMLGRATESNGGVMPQGVAQLALSQLREVNSLVQSCAAIEAKRQDQQLDAAKLILLLGRLRDDLRLSLKEAGLATSVPFVDAAFARARWTGALDDAAVQAALQAPASFDIKFRPIERDSSGKLLEHGTAFDTPQDALANATDLDLTARSQKLQDVRASAPGRVPAPHASDDAALQEELAAANAALDKEIEDAAEAGAPLPGAAKVREDRAVKKMLEGR